MKKQSLLALFFITMFVKAQSSSTTSSAEKISINPDANHLQSDSFLDIARYTIISFYEQYTISSWLILISILFFVVKKVSNYFQS